MVEQAAINSIAPADVAANNLIFMKSLSHSHALAQSGGRKGRKYGGRHLMEMGRRRGGAARRLTLGGLRLNSAADGLTHNPQNENQGGQLKSKYC